MAIYDEKKMKQKEVYATKQTPQYSDWALFNMGKELEKKVDDLDPGESKTLEVDQPITLTEDEDSRIIGLNSGRGLDVNSNGELVLNMRGCFALGFDWPTDDQRLHLRLIQLLSGGTDIGVNNPSDDYITLSIINKISTDALWEQMTDESEYLPAVGQVKKRINAKQDQLYTDGLSAIEISDRAQGGKYIRADVGPIESGSMKLVRSSQIKSALDTKQDNLTFPSSGGLVKDSSNNVRINVGDGLEMNVSGELCVDSSIERTVRTALPLAKNAAGTLILKVGSGLIVDSNGNLGTATNVWKTEGRSIQDTTGRTVPAGGRTWFGLKVSDSSTEIPLEYSPVTLRVQLPGLIPTTGFIQKNAQGEYWINMYLHNVTTADITNVQPTFCYLVNKRETV